MEFVMRHLLAFLLSGTLLVGAIIEAGAGTSGLTEATASCKRASDRPTVISACSVVIGLSHDRKLLERAYNRRGMAEEQEGQFERAVSDYSDVIRLNPTIAGYFDNRMRAYKGAGQLDLALRDANTAVRMAPGYAFALHGRGSVFFDKGDFGSAVRDFSGALAINGRDPALHVDRGRALIKLGNIKDALLDFEAAHAIDPAFEPALRERGIAYATLGRTQEARSDLSAAVAISPSDEEAAAALRRLEASNRAATDDPVSKPARPTPGSGVSAPPGSSRDDVTPPSGAPFCVEKEELQEFLLAALKEDQRWMSQLKSCGFVKGGLKIAVIDAGEPRNGMHIDKVRIFGSDGSMVGYTLTVDKDGN